MTSGIVNENAEEKKTMLEPEAVVEVLPKTVPEPPLYVKIRDVSRIELSKRVPSYLKFAYTDSTSTEDKFHIMAIY